MAATASIVNARKSYSVENNNEIQIITFTVKRTSGTTHWDDNKPLVFKLTYNNDNGTTTTLTQTVQFNFKTSVSSKSVSVEFTVPHKTDGKQSITYEASITTGTSVGTLHPTGSATLETIPRASSITGGSGNIESQTNIIINRASSNFTHTLKYEFKSLSATIISKTTNTSVPWTIPTSFYAQIPDSNSGTGKIICETYSEDTLVGSVETQFTAYVTNSNPVFEPSQLTYRDINNDVIAITQNALQIVRNLSILEVSFTGATPKNGSHMSKYEILFNGTTQEKTRASTINYGTVNLSQNTEIKVKAIDSRGNSTTITKTVIILDWILPTASITARRLNNYEDNTTLTVNATCSSVDNKNSIKSVQYRYKKNNDQVYSDYIDISNDSSTIISLNKLFAWNIQVKIMDEFGTLITNINVATGNPIMFIDIRKLSVAINSFPTGDGEFNVAGKIKQNGTALQDLFLLQDGGTITNDLTVNGTLSNPIFNNLKGSSLSNKNYNDMTLTGFYYMLTGCTNAPTDYCWLQVLSNNGDIVQIATSVSNLIVYYRVRNNGNWSSWKTLSTQENITSGSNSNGSWVKYPDGTMICYYNSGSTSVTLNANSVLTVDMTFPQPFINNPEVTTNMHSDSLATEIGYIQHSSFDITTTGFKFRWFSKASTARYPYYGYVAYGKWK